MCLRPLNITEDVLCKLAQIPLGPTRYDSTSSTCRAHAFWLCRHCQTAQLDSLDTTSSIGSTRRSRLARHDDSDSQLSLLCNFYKVMIPIIHLLLNVIYSLIYWFLIYLVYFI